MLFFATQQVDENWRQQQQDGQCREPEQRHGNGVRQFAQPPEEGRCRCGREHQASGGNFGAGEVDEFATQLLWRMRGAVIALHAGELCRQRALQRILLQHLCNGASHPIHVGGGNRLIVGA